MDKKELDKFLNNLSKTFFLFAPQEGGNKSESKISELKAISDIDWSGKMPVNSWKEVFLPHYERLFNIAKNKLEEIKIEYPKIACVGMNILDLSASTLFEQVFSKDSYYQKRRRNLLLIGYSINWPNDYKKYKVFTHSQEEDILEHVVFDVFFVRQKNGNFKVYSGSEKGQVILEELGIKKYQHVEFAGPISEKGPDKKMMILKKKMETSEGKKIWEDLGKTCIACGKCSIVCPTCFCFDISDSSDPNNSSRSRRWGNCFYNDFSKVAGGHKELDIIKKKIFFWYYHKFVRIPHEYSLPGCVGCNRCSQVCPVGIKINEVLKKI